MFLIPWQQVARHVRQQVSAGDVVFCDDPSLRYYLERQPLDENSKLYGPLWQEELGLIVNEGHFNKFCLVLTARDSRMVPEIYEILKSKLDQAHKLIARKDFLLLDPYYKKLKELIQKRASYKAKVSVYTFEK